MDQNVGLLESFTVEYVNNKQYNNFESTIFNNASNLSNSFHYLNVIKWLSPKIGFERVECTQPYLMIKLTKRLFLIDPW